MGMDVYGKNATTEKGEYFRNNVWWWHPLWDYCCEVYPPCREISGHTNDGHGLDDMEAKELSEILLREMREGRTAEYERSYMAELEALPKVQCEICKGTGQREDGYFGVEWKQKGCNGCNGEGTKKAFATSYPFSVENVKEFAEFLADSGGFEIC